MKGYFKSALGESSSIIINLQIKINKKNLIPKDLVLIIKTFTQLTQSNKMKNISKLITTGKKCPFLHD